MKVRRDRASKIDPLESWEIMPVEELKRRVRSYRGPSSPGPRGQPRSTKIRIWDIALLAKIRIDVFRFWLKGTVPFGKVRLRRTSKIVRLVDAGMISKIKHGKYVFHDTPVAPPVREMRVNIGVEGVSLTRVPQAAPPKMMPNFSTIFGGRK